MLKYYYKTIKVLETILNLLITFALNILYIFRSTAFPKINSHKIIHILGNGPSLKSDINKIISSSKKTDNFMVVNLFAKTKLYEKLKPSFYALVDPDLFKKNTNNIDANIQKDILNPIINKTNWPLKLFLPFSARKSQIYNNILKSGNSKIKVIFIKNVPIIGGSQGINNFLFKHNLANPLYQNVLIYAIFISIKMKFTNIYLWGADHSWHEDFILRKDNKIFTPDKHFYDNDKSKGFIHCNPSGVPIKVHELFHRITRALKIYHDLESYSKMNNCKIINLSSKTWIDAFTREEI